jgi:hypothetical protein
MDQLERPFRSSGNAMSKGAALVWYRMPNVKIYNGQNPAKT